MARQKTSLKATDVPSANAPWTAIEAFALTLNGYEAIGEVECGDLANRLRSEFEKNPKCLQQVSLEETRACLFFEQRRFRHFDEEPDGADLVYIRGLLETIRTKVGR
jgi:hypothetical protein